MDWYSDNWTSNKHKIDNGKLITNINTLTFVNNRIRTLGDLKAPNLRNLNCSGNKLRTILLNYTVHIIKYKL